MNGPGLQLQAVPKLERTEKSALARGEAWSRIWGSQYPVKGSKLLPLTDTGMLIRIIIIKTKGSEAGKMQILPAFFISSALV